MHTTNHPNADTTPGWITTHPVSVEDRIAMIAMRAVVEPNKGRLRGIAARGAFDGIMERVTAPGGVISYRFETIGGVPGWWCQPDGARPDASILHLHGGWFNWGSAEAFRNLVGHIASRVGVAAFVPDYRLAPEHPFPAALDDVRACYFGLVQQGFSQLAVTGDSAGGNLALGLLAFLSAKRPASKTMPVAAVALSPVTDLALAGASWETRASDDPYFVRAQAAELVRSYLNDTSPTDPMASPLYAELAGLPPIRIQVGEDEVLLDDSFRFVERAIAAGVDAKLDVWEGMAHGFLSGVGRLRASTEALNLIGDFLTERLTTAQNQHE
ncbi:MAG TPA: alpha/beta hydrolase [Chthoniobacterales bacterium]|nr:alpha/beta hydrolase [Chthoniobacterales bacterium]